MKVLSRVLLLTVLAFSQLSVAGQDQKTSNASPEPGLERVASLIHQLRTGDLQRFRIDLGADSFTVLKSVEEPLTEAEAKAELQNAKPAAPTLRFTRTQELMCRQVSPGVWIEQAMNTDKDFHGSIWSKRTLETVGTYSNSLWDAFARMAIENGLSDFRVSNSSEGRRAELAFDSDGAPAIRYGSQSLVLSKDFYRVMRVSTEYKPVSGRNGFVVLIHDPHQSVKGRFALMQGLNTLLGANAKRPVEFLVEGAFPEKEGVNYQQLPARLLSDGGLAQRMEGTSESIRAQLIYSMLSTYLIDTPLAYRILNHRSDIPAFAIDDNRYLREVDMEAPKEIDKAVNTILNHLDGDSLLKARGALGLFETLARADAQQISDLQLVGFYREMASTIRAFASIAEKNATSDISSSIQIVNKFAESYEKRANQYERALERNKTMLTYIKQEGARAAQRLPIAFIGSFHTWGIVEELRKAGIGYVVIEPRQRIGRISSSESKTFDQFLINPDGYFASVLHSNKGIAGLTAEQVDKFHAPYIVRQTERLAEQSAALERLRAGSNTGGKINGSLIEAAVRQNGSLNEATVEIGGNGSGVPPDAPRGAFAFFDEHDGKRRLVLLGADDNRWGSEERYSCLEHAIFDLPTGEAATATFFHLSKHYQDEKTGRVYYTSYDRSSKRLYLVEASVANAGALLSLSAIRRGGAVNVHVVVSDLMPGESRVEHTSADNGTGMVN